MQIIFPTTYPFKPPGLKFTVKVYHPNVAETGVICFPMLDEKKWTPQVKLVDVLDGVIAFLASPNPDNAAIPEIATQLKNNKDAFDATAREWARTYAKAI